MKFNATFEDRFWPKVQPTGFCWNWTAAKTKAGYGNIANSPGPPVLSHRAAYELLVGVIPQGMTLDHLCRNTLCVNPDHLEVVTIGVNVARNFSPPSINARKTHCPSGHEYTSENLVSDRGRRCKACHREKMRVRREASRAHVLQRP